MAKRIGGKLKELRKQEGFTLKKLGELTKLSPPLLSRIEHGLVIPSISTLQAIAGALRVGIEYFFVKDFAKRYVISRKGSRKIVNSKKGIEKGVSYEIELLADGMENPFMEPVIARLVGKVEAVQPVSHGGQEFICVLEGRILLNLGEKQIILKKEDSAYFEGSIPHRAISLSKKPARTLNVHMIPGSRMGTFETG